MVRTVRQTSLKSVYSRQVFVGRLRGGHTDPVGRLRKRGGDRRGFRITALPGEDVSGSAVKTVSHVRGLTPHTSLTVNTLRTVSMS